MTNHALPLGSETIDCWKCGKTLHVDLAPDWGVHMDNCMAATGRDGLRYDIVPASEWPADDPSGPRFRAVLNA